MTGIDAAREKVRALPISDDAEARHTNPAEDAPPEEPTGATFFAQLRPPPGRSTVPAFQQGWATEANVSEPYLFYVDFTGDSWSDDLEEIHEESSRDHFMDVLTRD